MKIAKKISKYIDYAETKIILAFKEKHYLAKENDINLKYIFKRHKESKKLIVIFSACTRPGIKARYNYFRTLKNVKVNKLFILDDISDDGRGCYYLGKYPDFLVNKAVKDLIDKIIKDVNPNDVYFAGSSKGAYAAMYFGTMYDDVKVIMGAPQYKLGDYLNRDAYRETFDYIRDGNNAEVVSDKLNKLMELSIKKGNPRKVYMHYSDSEHTYKEHIIYLINELNNNGYEIETDVKHYKSHGDVSLYFPEFFRSIVED